MNWREYQDSAAEFFCKLGLDTKIEHKIEGVRGIHEVDVFAAGKFNGIEFNWVIECKHWKSNVPKEKVMALYSIVQDVGADRGFLLSETGFQSGAINASRLSNITLTSLEDLSLTAEKLSVDYIIGQKSWDIAKARARLLEIKRKSEAHEYHPERLMLSGELGVIQTMLDDALSGGYPILYPVKGLTFSTLTQLMRYVDEYVEKANNWNI